MIYAQWIAFFCQNALYFYTTMYMYNQTHIFFLELLKNPHQIRSDNKKHLPVHFVD